MDYQKMGNNDDDLTKREVMNMGIINQYGQLMGEFSRLDDELWLCKSDDNDGFVHSTAAFHWDVFSNNVELKKLSHIVDDSFSNGSSAVAKGSSSSLADSSLDQSPNLAPIPTPQSKRTYLNVRTSVTKRARTKRHRPSIFNSHLNNPNTDCPLSDEMAKPAIRTKKVEDLLLSRDSEPPTPTPKRKLPKRGIKKCAHCESTRTPQWREGPLGRGTLCNACGVRFKNGRLCPEYRSRGPERREGNPSSGPKPTPKRKLSKRTIKKCAHCESTRTPQWREGPLGRGTLCNACGVQFKHGRLFPEYRPLSSPHFDPSLHSNMPKKVQQMRMNKEC